MIVYLPDQTKIHVTWRYDYQRGQTGPRPVGTACVVLDETKQQILGTSHVAVCQSKRLGVDTFSRPKGRKIALRKAIASFSREQRSAIWEQYFVECRI